MEQQLEELVRGVAGWMLLVALAGPFVAFVSRSTQYIYRGFAGVFHVWYAYVRPLAHPTRRRRDMTPAGRL